MSFLDPFAPYVKYCVVLLSIFRVVYSKWSRCAGCYFIADYMWFLLFAQAK